MPSSAVEIGRRLMLRTGGGPLRRFWSLAYEALMRGVSLYLLRPGRGTAYVGGTFGHGEPVFGVSDLDLIIVTEPGEPMGSARRRVELRWRRLRRLLGPLGRLVSEAYVYEPDELRAAVSTTCLTGPPERGVLLDPQAPADAALLSIRPGLSPAADWRRLTGPERRPDVPDGPQRRRLNAWLELQLWWRHAFRGCADPAAHDVAYLAVKLVTEPARILLWLDCGELIAGRRELLRRALEHLPEEGAAIHRALDLHEALPSSPEPPLGELLPTFVRLSSLVAARMEVAAERAGATAVRLSGLDRAPVTTAIGRDRVAGLPGAGGRELLPLADWRALANPMLPDESLLPLPGDAGDWQHLGTLAEGGGKGPYPAIRNDGLLVLPVPSPGRAALRSVQCKVTDPVSFALLEGRDLALFAELDGWSAAGLARRAVAEHRGWLACSRSDGRTRLRQLGLLFTAARAGLFLESMQEPDPELDLTVTAVAARLAEWRAGSRTVVEEAAGAFSAARPYEREPEERTVAAFERVVREVPAYAAA